MKRLSVILLLLLLAPAGWGATDRYIDAVGGTDAGAGGIGAPWKTLAYTSTNCTDGDTLYFQAGQIHRGQIAATDKGVHLRVYGTGAIPILRGVTDISNNAWTDQGDGVWSQVIANAEFVGVTGGAYLDGVFSADDIPWDTDLATTKPYMPAGSYTYNVNTIYVKTNDGLAPTAANGHQVEVPGANTVWSVKNASTAYGLVFEGGRYDVILPNVASQTHTLSACVIRFGVIGVGSTTAGITVNLYNCLIVQNVGSGVFTNHATTTINLVNSTVAGNALATGYGLQNSAGTITKQTSNIIGNGARIAWNSTGTITDNGGNLAVYPKFTGVSNSEVVLSLDDWNSPGTFQDRIDLMDAANAAGLGMTWFLTHGGMLSGLYEGYIADAGFVRVAGDARNSVENHSRSHSGYGRTSDGIGPELAYAGFAVRYIGAGAACTASYNATTSIFTTTVDGTPDLSIDATGRTLLWLEQQIDADSDYTATAGVVADGYVIDDYVYCSVIDDFTNQDIRVAAYALPLDLPDWYEHEISDTNTQILSITGATVHGLALPQGGNSAAAMDDIYGYDIWGARGTTFNTDNQRYALKNLQRVGWIPAMPLASLNASQLATEADHVATMAALWPMQYHLWCHSELDISAANFTTFVTALAATGIPVTTFAASVSEQNTNGAWASNRMFSLRAVSAGTDYRLLPGSPCIRKGTDLGDGASYLDFAGFNPDVFGWNMGAYCSVWQFDGPKLQSHMNNALNGVLQ